MFQVKIGHEFWQQTIIILIWYWSDFIVIFNKRIWRWRFGKNTSAEVVKMHYWFMMSSDLFVVQVPVIEVHVQKYQTLFSLIVNISIPSYFFIITLVFQQVELWNFAKLSMKDKFTTWKRNKLFSICRSYYFFESMKNKKKIKKQPPMFLSNDKNYCTESLE